MPSDAVRPLLFQPKRLAQQPIALDEFGKLLEIEAEPSGSGEGRGWETLSEGDGLRLERRTPAPTDETGAELLVVRCSLTLPEVPPSVAVESLYDLEKRAEWDHRLEVLQLEDLAGVHPSPSGAGPSSEVLRSCSRPLLGVLPACEVLQWRALTRPAGTFAAWLQRDADLPLEDDEDAGMEEGAWPAGWGLLPSWGPIRMTNVTEGHVVRALVPNCAAMGTRVFSYFQVANPNLPLRAMAGGLLVELARSASSDFRDACLAAVAAGYIVSAAWLPAEECADFDPSSPCASARRRLSRDAASPEFFDIASHFDDSTPSKEAARCSSSGCDFLGSASSWLVPGAQNSVERRAAAAARPSVLRPTLGDATLTVQRQLFVGKPHASREDTAAGSSPERHRRASRARDRSHNRERNRMASMAQRLNQEMTRSTGALEAVSEGEHGEICDPEGSSVGGCVAAHRVETSCHGAPLLMVCEDDPIEEFASALEAAVACALPSEDHADAHPKLCYLVPPLQLRAHNDEGPFCEKDPVGVAVCRGDATSQRRFSLPMPTKRRTKRAPPTGVQHQEPKSDHASAQAVSTEVRRAEATRAAGAPASRVPGAKEKAHHRAGAVWGFTGFCAAMPDKAAAQTVAVAAALAAFSPEDLKAGDALGPVAAVLASLGPERGAREELPEPDAEATPRPRLPPESASPSPRSAASRRRATRKTSATPAGVTGAASFCFAGHPTCAEVRPQHKAPRGEAPRGEALRDEAFRDEAPHGESLRSEPSPGESLRAERRRSERAACKMPA